MTQGPQPIFTRNSARRGVLLAVFLVVAVVTVVFVSNQRSQIGKSYRQIEEEMGLPTARAESFRLQTADIGSDAVFKSQELVLVGIYEADPKTPPNGAEVWIYSQDSRVKLHLNSVLQGQFSGVTGEMTFVVSPSFEARIFVFESDGVVSSSKTCSAAFLKLRRRATIPTKSDETNSAASGATP